jgi:hypothetical protein
MAASANLYPFLFMGCWNKNGAPRDAVTSAISADPIQRLFLGGDNIYPDKKDGVKVYSKNTLTDGASKLVGKNIFAAYGNHNVGFYDAEGELWKIPSNYYSIDFADVSMVVLDTNVITGAEFDAMRIWLARTLSVLKSTGKPYYLIQHEPFMSFKKKKNQMYLRAADVLKILITYPPIAVLCADTHNYQVGMLTFGGVSIKQIIVGTGGAEPDPILTEETVMVLEGIHYTKLEHTPGYGYLRVFGSDAFEFVKVRDWESSGGGRSRRRHRHKRKTCRSKRL